MVQNGIKPNEYQKRRREHIEQIAAMNLFADYRPGSRKAGRGVYDADGNYFPSLTAAAAVYGVTIAAINQRITRGKMRYA